MSLVPGARLGPYEIVAAIGAGGMGEVYRANDTNLNRDVAIKVLPDLFARDSERLARFTREAQTLASLNHPYIAAIYGFEKVEVGSGFSRTSALIMELVQGDTGAHHGRAQLAHIGGPTHSMSLARGAAHLSHRHREPPAVAADRGSPKRRPK